MKNNPGSTSIPNSALQNPSPWKQKGPWCHPATALDGCKIPAGVTGAGDGIRAQQQRFGKIRFLWFLPPCAALTTLPNHDIQGKSVLPRWEMPPCREVLWGGSIRGTIPASQRCLRDPARQKATSARFHPPQEQRSPTHSSFPGGFPNDSREKPRELHYKGERQRSCEGPRGADTAICQSVNHAHVISQRERIPGSSREQLEAAGLFGQGLARSARLLSRCWYHSV